MVAWMPRYRAGASGLGRTVAALVLLAAACATSELPEDASYREWAPPQTDVQRPSGLRVIVEEDHTDPVVVVAAVFGVGGTSDPKGSEGLAHFVEHLVFRARPDGGDQVWDRLKRMGASFNASTAADETNYYVIAHKDELERMMQIQALRLLDPLGGVVLAPLEEMFSRTPALESPTGAPRADDRLPVRLPIVAVSGRGRPEAERRDQLVRSRAGDGERQRPAAAVVDLEPELDTIRGCDRGKAVEPLDRDRRPFARLEKAQLGELGGVVHAVEVGVDERDAAGVLVDQGEGGACDAAIGRNGEAAGQPLRERGLAAAERSDKADHVAHPEERAQPLAERARLPGRGRPEGHVRYWAFRRSSH